MSVLAKSINGICQFQICRASDNACLANSGSSVTLGNQTTGSGWYLVQHFPYGYDVYHADTPGPFAWMPTSPPRGFAWRWMRMGN